MNKIEKRQKSLFDIVLPDYKRYLPIVENKQKKPCEINLWDIPYTISQLSYYVHSHYRYYGKFPSVVAGQLLEDFPPPSKDHYVFDNFCGSGSTLVEAKLRGIKSYGIDISWISVLVSNVKVRNVNLKKIMELMNRCISYCLANRNKENIELDDFLRKWFNPEAVIDLKNIQKFINNIPPSFERDFMLVAFLGILRRVSKAYDGEVRPHINKKKKYRDVLQAFSKKIQDMYRNHDEFMSITDPEIESKCYLGDSLHLPEKFEDGLCYLVISHPPYLNSFNYTPVYSLEFYWGKAFEPEYAGKRKIELYKNELKVHPATEKIVKKYFEHLRLCYSETYKIQPDSSYLAIVIGDCTRNKKRIPVIKRIIEIVERIGYKLYQINYRTTYYGLGKYAYRDRADYHSPNSEKKDGVLVFKK